MRLGTASEGRRVVAGQRIMQADTDIFLGWAEAEHLDFYVRQLRDMKGSANFATMRAAVLADYLRLCGWTLARAHARTGAAPEIAGYLGKGVAFDRALTRFAVAYADQTARDHAALQAPRRVDGSEPSPTDAQRSRGGRGRRAFGGSSSPGNMAA